MKPITVSIMPTYFCKNQCEYCYLGDARNNQNMLDLNVLQTRLIEISSVYTINAIETYGGDLNLLPDYYLAEMFKIIRKFSRTVYCTALPSEKLFKYISAKHINVSVNSNRRDYEQSLQIAKGMGCNVITVCLEHELNMPVAELLERYNGIKGYVTFMPYSESVANKGNNIKRNNTNYDMFLLNIVKEYVKGNYTFKLSNLEIMKDAINGYYDPLMEHNIFVTPMGHYANIEFVDSKEFFKEHNNLESWRKRAELDKLQYAHVCGHCEYYMNGCSADHVPVLLGCNGCKETVTWIKENVK